MEKNNIKYQKEAIWGCIDEAQEGLLKITNKYLAAKQRTSDYPEVILKAITGAGKTIIMADYINAVLEQEHRPEVAFIWLSIGTSRLQFQSAEKITPLLSSKVGKVICPETEKDFNETSFSDGELLILNWEKINNTKKDQLVSNLMSGEKHNLKQAILNTEKIRFIILIDEFHLNYRTEAYNLIMDLFKPAMILGMTATPRSEQLANKSDMHIISTAKVREEGMIKKGIFFNQDLEKIVLNENDNYGLNEEILKVAIKKRVDLERKMREEDSNVIPLCLIQVPNNNKSFLESIITFLESQTDNDKVITVNEDYICWMSETSKDSNLLNLIKNINNNSIKYIIFKQAVATGWDCPRAHILVKFRPLKRDVEPFDLQTIGRVLRMPEKHFYKSEDLNYAYIYSPEKRFNYDKDVEKALGNIETKNQKIKFLNDINLVETFLETEKIKEIPIDFSTVKKIFLNILEDEFNIAKVNKEFSKIHIFNTKLETDDKLLNGNINDTVNENETVIEYNTVQLNRMFRAFLSNIEKTFLKKNDLKVLLFTFFEQKLKLDLSTNEGIIEAIKYCLMYEKTIHTVMLKTNNTVHQQIERKRDKNKSFRFLRSPKYFVDKVEKKYLKCLYTPCVNNGFSEPERIFIQELENNKRVKWWFKNLDKGQNGLSIIYTIESTVKGTTVKNIAPTFPDFIVFFEDKENHKKSIGIYEIKDVDKIEDVNDKKDKAIQDFIKRMLDEIDKKSIDINRVYGGVVKIKNLKRIDEDGNLIGEIDNKSSYQELINYEY